MQIILTEEEYNKLKGEAAEVRKTIEDQVAKRSAAWVMKAIPILSECHSYTLSPQELFQRLKTIPL